MAEQDRLKGDLVKRARALGFDVCKITKASLPAKKGEQLSEAVQRNYHGSMNWMATTLERRLTPTSMWSDAKSSILLGMNYGPKSDPLVTLRQDKKATISVYARNRDYHDVIKGKLKTLAGWLASKTNAEVKVFVDTAPLMEKPLAEQAGIGWQGKHTNLVSKDFGSWLFLGSILTEVQLETDEPEIDHCGSCRACLDVCPTDAFPGPYQLDARRCISYLTIEHHGPIPETFRAAMGNRIYGCDDCLAVCPWNKFAVEASEAKLVAKPENDAPDLEDLAQLDDASFRKKFSGSPIKRIGRDRFLRNVLTAVGNSGCSDLLDTAYKNLDEIDPVVRGAAVWAVYRLEERDKFIDMRNRYLKKETDPYVRLEWNRP
ncbi:MAG: tRNA epoxyqueuosine(34) reductase QueG [Pseudomonadota bacterium]